ncbi:MAG: ACP S-malonyltransferase [Anaerolineales bacterium]|nr:ACP S-malonyltransferase [Anaerolineales bacterium]
MGSAFLFPGQGSQKVGMGQVLYAQSPAAQKLYDTADALLGWPLSQLCFAGPEEKLTVTVNQQPALFVTNLAIWQAMLADGWQKPDFVAGHSLGELPALVAAGAIQFEDGLRLVQKRGELMQLAGELNPGAMAAILALDSQQIVEICTQASKETGLPVQLANDNCPGQVVISGDETALTRALELAQEAKARKIVRLPITIAAHSSLMNSIADDFATAVDDTPIQTPTIPIIGNVTAKPLVDIATIQAELKAQLTASVQWTDSMRYLLDQGVDTFVEVGPGNVLLGLIKRLDRQTKRLKFELE